MYETQSQMVKMVIDGLAQVAQAVSNSSLDGRSSYWPNTQRDNNRLYNAYVGAGMNNNRRNWIHNAYDHELQNCNTFETMNLNSRMEAVRLF